MAGFRAANDQRSVHVHVVAREVEGNQALEDDSPAGEGGREKDEQAGRGAAVRDHVENSAEPTRLLEYAGNVAVDGIEEARDTIEERAGSRMQRHIVERGKSEDDSDVIYRSERVLAMCVCVGSRSSYGYTITR